MPKKDFGDFVLTYDNSQRVRSKVFDYLMEHYFLKHKAFNGETIMQSDECTIDAPEILSDLCDIIRFKVEWKDEM